MLVSEEGLVAGEEGILVVAEAELDMRVYRSQSWFMELAKILLLLCSEAY